jgi:hypothetical protein
MERLKAWLEERGIVIVRPRIGTGGLITLRLRPLIGSEFEVDFYPNDLEADPDNAIATIQNYLATRSIKLG